MDRDSPSQGRSQRPYEMVKARASREDAIDLDRCGMIL